MCLQPQLLEDGTSVACRYCTQCRAFRVQTYVGKCLAEAAVSDVTLAVTLTYRPGEPHSQYLVYSDFQKALKRLRKAGYQVRYIVAGEYGGLRGRAHWHAILFLRGASAGLMLTTVGKPIQMNKRQWVWWWPHGHAHFKWPDRKGFAYLLKYTIKSETSGQSFGRLAMSKKPPLGHDHFIKLGTSYAEQGHLPPQAVHYVGGRPYPMRSSSRDAFLRSFAARYWQIHARAALILPDWVYRTIHQENPDPERSADVLRPEWEGYFDEQTQERYQGTRLPINATTNPTLRRAYWAREGIAEFHARQTCQKGGARLHGAPDTCPCAPCCLRRAEASLHPRLFPTRDREAPEKLETQARVNARRAAFRREHEADSARRRALWDRLEDHWSSGAGGDVASALEPGRPKREAT